MVAVACNNMREGLECLPHTPSIIQNATEHHCIALDLYNYLRSGILDLVAGGRQFCCNLEYSHQTDLLRSTTDSKGAHILLPDSRQIPFAAGDFGKLGSRILGSRTKDFRPKGENFLNSDMSIKLRK